MIKLKVSLASSLIFKCILWYLLVRHYNITSLHIPFAIFCILNLFMIPFSIKIKEETVKITIFVFILIDLFYSLFINFAFYNRIQTIFYFYPITVSIYYVAGLTFIKNIFFNYIMILYSAFLFINMLFLVKNENDVFNIAFYAMFCLQNIVFGINTVSGNKK